jgi:phosphoribosylanthranilate isomerase
VTAIKICGLTDERGIEAANRLKLDFIGFVYFPASPRHIPLMTAAALKSILDPSIKTVSVLVDPSDALIDEVMASLTPDYIQLHGRETSERISAIKARYTDLRIIKGIQVSSSDDVARAMHFGTSADLLLFDAKPPTAAILPGGNGLPFDWALLKHRTFPLPWMLSGGLNEANVGDAIYASGATMVDVSSGVESAPGVKDPQLMEAFVRAVRGA